MREIKFRAWDEALKHWDSHPQNAIGLDGRLRFGNADITGYPLTIEQFTGLKDKRGNDVYEGDIVCFVDDDTGDEVNREIFFDEECLNYGIRMSIQLFHVQFSREFEVIGNIHENPELIK